MLLCLLWAVVLLVGPFFDSCLLCAVVLLAGTSSLSMCGALDALVLLIGASSLTVRLFCLWVHNRLLCDLYAVGFA